MTKFSLWVTTELSVLKLKSVLYELDLLIASQDLAALKRIPKGE